MSTIRQQDLIDSIADSLQFISYYHPKDYIQALGKAYEREESLAANGFAPNRNGGNQGFLRKTA